MYFHRPRRKFHLKTMIPAEQKRSRYNSREMREIENLKSTGRWMANS